MDGGVGDRETSLFRTEDETREVEGHGQSERVHFIMRDKILGGSKATHKE